MSMRTITYNQSGKELIRMYLYKKMEILLFVMLATLLTGCGGGGGGSSTQVVVDPSTQAVGGSSTQAVETSLSSTAVQKGHITDSLTGKGLANVEVHIGSQTTTTDSNGFYTIDSLIERDEEVINFEKEGYLLGSTLIQIKSLSGDNKSSSNYLEYSMSAYSDEWDNGKEWTYESQNGATGGAVEIPAGKTYTNTKSIYSGTVTARWVFKDTMTSEGRDAFPGSFKGINTNGVPVPFVSYGLTSLELENDDGESLNLQENITLILPSITGTTQSIIPLWYYDYDQGLWFEDGYAERQTDGTYRADISHTGTWSLSQPIEEEVGIYRGSIVDKDGLPMTDVRLQAVGNNWISSDLSTDEDGVFEIVVIPGEDFKLKAYHYEDKYAAESGTIAAVSSGEIVEI